MPSDTVSRVVPQLIEAGHAGGTRRPAPPDHVTARAGLGGVAVYAVFEQTPAAHAGLAGVGLNRFGELVFGDIIVAVDGQAVTTIEDVQAILDPRQPGDSVELTVARAGKSRKITLTLIEE